MSSSDPFQNKEKADNLEKEAQAHMPKAPQPQKPKGGGMLHTLTNAALTGGVSLLLPKKPAPTPSGGASDEEIFDA